MQTAAIPRYARFLRKADEAVFVSTVISPVTLALLIVLLKTTGAPLKTAVGFERRLQAGLGSKLLFGERLE